MVTIREVLEAEGVGAVYDKSLLWGASAEAYTAEIADVQKAGQWPVLVELDMASTPDLLKRSIHAADLLSGAARLESNSVIVVDHHGARAADVPTALEQVLDLLGARQRHWTWWHQLVAANDRGHVLEMLNLGATDVELRAVRKADRTAQGITVEQELQGAHALSMSISPCEALTVVSLPHDHSATVTDRIEPSMGGPGYNVLLVQTPIAAHVFGDGATVLALAEAFPDGWYGGALPARGFWGRSGPSDDIGQFLRARLCGG